MRAVVGRVIVGVVGFVVIVYFRGRWGTLLHLVVSIPVVMFWIVAVIFNYADPVTSLRQP